MDKLAVLLIDLERYGEAEKLYARPSNSLVGKLQMLHKSPHPSEFRVIGPAAARS